MKWIGILVVVAAVALAVTNPSMDDFSTFISEYSEDVIEREVGDSAVGRAIARFGSSLAGDLIERATERNNYVVLSTYAIGDNDESGDPWTFVGIGGQFLELNRPEDLQDD